MANSLSLSAEASLGASCPYLEFQTVDQCVTIVGQQLKFATCDALLDPDQTRLFPGCSPHGITLVATCPKAGLFAYTARALDPEIHICSYPDFTMVQSLTHSGTHEFTAVAFLRSGKLFAALTAAPDPQLVIWSLGQQAEPAQLLTAAALPAQSAQLTFDPSSSSGTLCTLAEKQLLVWNLRLVYQTYLLESAEVLYDADIEAGPDLCIWTDHAWAPGSSLYAGTESGTVMVVGKDHQARPCMRMETPVRAIVIDATHLVVGSSDGSVSWFVLDDLDADVPLFTISFGAGAVHSLVASPDFMRMLATTTDGEIYLVSYNSSTLPHEPIVDPSEIVSTARVTSFHTGIVSSVASLSIPVSCAFSSHATH